MKIRLRMIEKLSAALEPEHLEVVDDSHKHAGHLGMPTDASGETHFTIKVVSACFTGKSRVARHRLVNEALADELAGPVHALAIEARAPGEA